MIESDALFISLELEYIPANPPSNDNNEVAPYKCSVM